MYAYQTGAHLVNQTLLTSQAAPAPPHSLPHMAAPINPPHGPPQSYNTGHGYTHTGGSPYAACAAPSTPSTVGHSHGYAPPMQSYTVNSHPHHPAPQPTVPSPGFNDFGMPSSTTSAHPATVGGFPSRSPAPRPSGYQGFQGFPQSPPPPPGPEAIPSPVRRADYQAPQFKTFAERKRERENELRRQAAEAAAAQVLPSPPPSTKSSPMPPSPSPSPSQRYSQPQSPNAAFNAPPRTPSAAAMRMMANPTGGTRPMPPPRSLSGPAPPQSPGGRTLPTPRGASGPSPGPSSQPWANGPAPPVPPIPPQHQVRSVSPAPPQRPISPVPPQQVRSVSPTPVSAGMHSASPALPPRSVSPAPQQIPFGSSPGVRSVSPVPPLHSIPTGNTGRPVLPPGVVHNAAVQALLERSDTVSSVRSVDRGGFGPKRILPQPPVGVKSSLSLDRGTSPTGRNVPLPRRGPSPVAEESSEMAVRMAAMSIGATDPPRVPSPAPSRQPRSQSPTKRAVPSINVGPPPPLPVLNVGPPPQPPVISVEVPTSPPTRSRSPAPPSPARPSITVAPPAAPIITVGSDSPPTPTITVGTPPTPTIAVSPPGISIDRPPSPLVSYSGLPTIEVSSSHTSYEPDAGPLSIAVPTINVGNGAANPRNSPRSSGPTRIQPSSAIMCSGCHHPIIGRIVSAIGQRWHPQCFKCDLCSGPLEHVSSYEHEGKPHCHLCYHDRFAHKCHHCNTAIVDPRFITLNDEVLGERYYHELHFFCSECGDPFLDPSKSSAAGTEVGAPHDDDGETNAFVIHKGHPYCERCHLRLHKPKCRACKNPIPDIALSAMGAKWHAECFVCANCTSPFANNLFFPRDGKAFCTECFERMTDM